MLPEIIKDEIPENLGLADLPKVITNVLSQDEGALKTYILVDSFCLGCRQRSFDANGFTHILDDGSFCGPIVCVSKEFVLDASAAGAYRGGPKAWHDLLEQNAKAAVDESVHKLQTDDEYYQNECTRFKVAIEMVADKNRKGGHESTV